MCLGQQEALDKWTFLMPFIFESGLVGSGLRVQANLQRRGVTYVKGSVLERIGVA